MVKENNHTNQTKQITKAKAMLTCLIIFGLQANNIYFSTSNKIILLKEVFLLNLSCTVDDIAANI